MLLKPALFTSDMTDALPRVLRNVAASTPNTIHCLTNTYYTCIPILTEAQPWLHPQSKAMSSHCERLVSTTSATDSSSAMIHTCSLRHTWGAHTASGGLLP